MTALSRQDMGGGLFVVAEDSGNVVLEKELGSVISRHTVTDVATLVSALEAAQTIVRTLTG